MSSIHVVKLGGSLLDLPDLCLRVEQWLGQQGGSRVLMIVGGGEAADLVRKYDKLLALGAMRSHWLAIRAMGLNAAIIAGLLDALMPVSDLVAAEHEWRSGRLVIVDPLAWLMRVENAGSVMPHDWSFTSDSIAAIIATEVNAQRLTLLKSVEPRAREMSLQAAAEAKIVDECFPEFAASLPGVELVNLRVDPFTHCLLR